MPSYILTDTKVPKSKQATHICIKTLPIPEKGVVPYRDRHPDAPKGLYFMVATSGSKYWVLRYKVDGQPRRYTLGHYPDYKPARARKEADGIRSDIRAKGVEGDPIAIREAEKQAEIEAREAEVQAEIEAREDELNKSVLTFGKLLEAYIKQLRRKGKASARSVETCLQKNVKRAFPKLWRKPAEDIDLDDCLDIVAAVADQEKMREAAKLRSYIRAAFTAAIKARGDAAAVKELRKFKLKHNPAASLATIDGNIRARNRVLSLPELKAYWQRISALPSPDGAVLRFHLLTGGQRLEQLFRLTVEDRDGDDIILLDPKGRRKEPRVHVVPLLPEAINALDEIGNGPFLVSFDGGKTSSTDSAFRSRIKTLSAAMLKDKEVTAPFTPGDIRRTVETRLSAKKVSQDHLKHLLSHGFGGVQDRHYQRYEYHAEKLAALVTLRDLLTTPSGDVGPIKRRAKK